MWESAKLPDNEFFSVQVDFRYAWRHVSPASQPYRTPPFALKKSKGEKWGWKKKRWKNGNAYMCRAGDYMCI